MHLTGVVSLCATTVFLVLVQCCSSARILFFLPIASKSHANVFEPLTRGLTERGHEVVNMSPFKLDNVPPNLKQIQIISEKDIFGTLPNPFESRKENKILMLMKGGMNWLNDACEKLLQKEEFHEFVTKEKFDLVIVHVVLNYCGMGALSFMEAPTILYTTMAAPNFIAIEIGNRYPPSFVVDTALAYTHKMTFSQRMMNTLVSFVIQTGSSMFLRPMEEMYRKYLPNGKDLPGIHEIASNTSMIFSNAHFALTDPKPLLPDSIEVGGMHTRPAKPLPKDIDDFLSGSGKDGFIFFSLGTIVRPQEMPDETRRIFVKAFSKLKQRVIWKWETETMPDVPKNSNILLRKWLPQQDILGHPNIKLFITHGGLLSTQEAVYHGVPLLGIPIAGDQDLNTKHAETSGYAKSLEILEMTEEVLEEAIMEMLNNPEYTGKVRELSKVARDLPQKPLETAIFWAEYVIRHKGAMHLRSAARDLNFIQYYVLDVIFVLTLIVIIFLGSSYLILRLVFRRLCGTKKSIKSSKKTQ